MSIHKPHHTLPCIAGLALLMALPDTTHAASVIDTTREAVHQVRGRTQDADAHPLGFFTSDAGGAINTTVGVNGGSPQRYDHNVIYRYALPTLAVGHTIESFTFNYQITALRDHSNDSYELDVYLLDVDDPTGTGTDLFFHGASDPAHAMVGSHFIDTESNTDSVIGLSVNVSFTISSGPSLALLQSFYGGDHIPDQDWASFRFNLDQLFVNSASDPLGGVALNRYIINNDVETSGFTITTIPEPTTALLGGLGMLALLRRRR